MATQPGEDRPTVLLSYDVSGTARSAAARVCQMVFGRADTPQGRAPAYIFRPGVVWVGQSVLLLPGPLADELATRLRGLGAIVSMAPVRLDPADLHAFRRRSRRGTGGEPP